MGTQYRVVMLLISILLIGSCTQDSKQQSPENIRIQDTKSETKTDTMPIQKDTVAVKIDTVRKDSTVQPLTDSTILGIRKEFPMPSGRVVNVLITGIDSRLGQKSARADANHIVRFFLDSGCIEIISIPRGTFAMIRKGDTSGGNIIANVRSIFGQERYIREVTKIAKVKSIDYYIEFGFSQAMGIIELLGYKDNAASTLRVLRSRKAFATGDHQRSYNQGQFIRQAILRSFDHTDDLMGQLGIRAALALSTTNLSYDAASYILDELRANGFNSNTPERIWVRMMPKSSYTLKVFDYDSANIANIETSIESKVKNIVGKNDRKNPEYYANILRSLLFKVEKDTNKPERVIDSLAHPFKQRYWIQIQNVNERIALRDKLCYMLVNAYNKKGKTAEAFEIVQYIEQEDAFRKSGTMK